MALSVQKICVLLVYFHKFTFHEKYGKIIDFCFLLKFVCFFLCFFFVHLLYSGTEKALIFLDDDSLSLNAVKSCCESIILRVHSLSKYDSLADVYAKYVDILDRSKTSCWRSSRSCAEWCNSSCSFTKKSTSWCIRLTEYTWLSKTCLKDKRKYEFTEIKSIKN